MCVYVYMYIDAERSINIIYRNVCINVSYIYKKRLYH